MLDLNAEGISRVDNDLLYAALYNKGYPATAAIGADWSAALAELLSSGNETPAEKKESSRSGGGSAAFKAPAAPEAPKIQAEEISEQDFSDIKGHWAEETIKALYAKKLVSGFADGSFRPDSSITRGEFVTMLARILPQDSSGEGISFDDVKKGDWYYEPVIRAAAAGIVQGTGGRFMPEQPITREQLAVMLYRALSPEGDGGTELAFADKTEISAYAQGAVSYLYEKGFLSGFEDNTLRPKRETCRAEAAKLLLSVYAELNQ